MCDSVKIIQESHLRLIIAGQQNYSNYLSYFLTVPAAAALRARLLYFESSGLRKPGISQNLSDCIRTCRREFCHLSV